MEMRTLKSRDELEQYYRSIIGMLQIEARYCGYALGVHGSLRRDLDLIAVPWVEKHRTPNFLAMRLMKKAGGITYPLSHIKKSWEKKPHGRIGITLPICNTTFMDQGSAWIDLSVKL